MGAKDQSNGQQNDEETSLPEALAGSIAQVTGLIEQHRLLPEAGSIVVAVSGGADSLCLLHMLDQLCGPGKRYPRVTLEAAHLDHMLRGEASQADALMLRELLNAWGIPLVVESRDVAALARRERRSLEEAARLVRYAFLREVAQGRAIAVAHHADDQAETLLLHWLRGSGLSGQVGMSPRQGDIIRPLLSLTRAQTQAYCAHYGIAPLEDQSNSDPRFLRNRIRHELLPLLSELNPNIVQTLLRNAEVVSVDLQWLEAQVDQCWPQVVLLEEDQAIQLDRTALTALPLSLQRHLLRRVGAHLCAGQSPLEPRHYHIIEEILREPPDHRERELQLPHGLRLLYHLNTLHFKRILSANEQSTQVQSTSREAQASEVLLPLSGSVVLPGTPWRVSAEIVAESVMQQVRSALQEDNWTRVWQLLQPVNAYSVFLDGSGLNNALLVRTRRAGDRMQPLGMVATKKVKDILIDKHIARQERESLPLFFAGSRCLWLGGICLDQSVALTAHTQRILHLTMQSE